MDWLVPTNTAASRAFCRWRLTIRHCSSVRRAKLASAFRVRDAVGDEGGNGTAGSTAKPGTAQTTNAD